MNKTNERTTYIYTRILNGWTRTRHCVSAYRVKYFVCLGKTLGDTIFTSTTTGGDDVAAATVAAATATVTAMTMITVFRCAVVLHSILSYYVGVLCA